jgi:hypothetical protein
MNRDTSNSNPFPHILMPKVLHHRVCDVTQNIRSLGVTIGFETRPEGISWNQEGFVEFLDEHLITYCFMPDGNSNISKNQVIKRAKEAYGFLSKYCDRWKQGKIEGVEFEKDYRPIQGVLGEWFLHSFCSVFFETQSLYSKVYLHQGKSAVHGFDIVHYKESENDLGFSLWLGEAKFHKTLSGAVSSALKSLEKACGYGYLKSQEREDGTKGEVAFISRYSTAGGHGENQGTVDKINEYLEKNIQISVDEFLEKITIPVLLVISETKISEISKMTDLEIKKVLTESMSKADTSFVDNLTNNYSELKAIDIRVIVLPLGNYESLVEYFEGMIMGAVKKDAL